MAHHRPSKHLRAARPLSQAGFQVSVHKYDGSWLVRQIRAGQSVKRYTCPECQRAIVPGQAHVVVWPAVPPIGSSSAVEFRRHFHSQCWAMRP
ncbi:hypothetical protein SAMN05443377_10566 [Propionibacterium cyclohexanicum]|uniref:ATP/GTP-binding protein n=1 Tax=Propionibacterium cyclohexanicum TaxID=64702 RepID=A0A1H9R2S2_9ACTN|nr:hypothetical protein [Propionibacterium cyclohexanicum]SER66359.1 hypothetical protein SAMN05443377_10566 [Propionibacterium cyclohexanicum]